MKGLLLIPGSKGKQYDGPEDDDDEDEEGDGEDEKFSAEDFQQLFDSFVSALGVAVKDSPKAAMRLKSLIEMCCAKYM